MIVIAASAMAVPPAVLLHEIGHFSADRAFGFESSLHYASTGFAGEAEFWRLVRTGDHGAASRFGGVRLAGVGALSGLLVSYVMIGLGVWGAARSGEIACAVVALSSAARFPLVLLLAALGRSEHTDEAHVAQTLGIPEGLLLALGLAMLLAATAGTWRSLMKRGRAGIMPLALAGVVAGTILWMAVLGPLILP